MRFFRQDFVNKTPTEIDFLGGKVVEYGHALGIPTPFFENMTNLVKIIENSYLKKESYYERKSYHKEYL